MKVVFFPLFLLLLIACGENKNGAGDGPKTQADSLLQEVLDGHDVVMPKMKKLERLMKASNAAVDSLNQLPAGKQNAALKVKMQALYTDLSNADKAMNDWMNGFKYDSFKNNEAARIKYLQDQKARVNEVKAQVLSSIDKADSVLEK
ncbi:viral A-type inclusion protein [Niabella ginsenosidivorans]|uniref:Viral A-type inclusion protein n=1 Tax=Niabella ginsenosidivorans TaxID=1176587 RepID=A0A1A9I8G2_9BACT|nr:viral A-type inclusion protein [Niabella ginsenosidivorans]ANH83359.1 viral A-type inclusion protein [Niabella ginsenosidivorans]